ncbi:MAG: metallophosphoesterase [Prosthecobacter sp.]|nr:metallophosphoesterase [Prosthecobacter sp.]
MPVTLPPLTRRRWLQGSLAAAFSPCLTSAAEAEGELWALFSDTHIAADLALEARGAVMGENLRRCVNQVLKVGQKPFGVLVNGDCAYLDGQQTDYDSFVKLMEPLRESGVQVHCTLGNHDHRRNFIAAMTSPQDPRPVEGRHVEVLSSATMNWVLLDSLKEVNQTPGELGALQIGWLDRTLASCPDRPTVVMAHHNPQAPVSEGQKPTGLMDAEAMFEVLGRHKKVKAFLYGHTHTWAQQRHEATGIHLVNLPPVAYVFAPERPNGWVIARASKEKLSLELRALNPAHDQHGEKVEIVWGS